MARNAARAIRQLPEPLVIYTKRGFDSYTYELHPRSERRLLAERPEARLPTRLTVAFEPKHLDDAMQETVVARVLPLLTGLTPEELQRQGVEVREPGSDRVVWQWPPGRR